MNTKKTNLEAETPTLSKGDVSGSNNIVKELKVHKLLGDMMEADMALYEKILDTSGFAYIFNELVKLAMK